jgi:hypothetical protein
MGVSGCRTFHPLDLRWLTGLARENQVDFGGRWSPSIKCVLMTIQTLREIGQAQMNSLPAGTTDEGRTIVGNLPLHQIAIHEAIPSSGITDHGMKVMLEGAPE